MVGPVIPLGVVFLCGGCVFCCGVVGVVFLCGVVGVAVGVVGWSVRAFACGFVSWWIWSFSVLWWAWSFCGVVGVAFLKPLPPCPVLSEPFDAEIMPNWATNRTFSHGACTHPTPPHRNPPCLATHKNETPTTEKTKHTHAKSRIQKHPPANQKPQNNNTPKTYPKSTALKTHPRT